MTVRRTVNAAMQALIDGTFGCLDAAAETINARLGGTVSKGTLSKRLSGQLGWPVEEVMALEDAAGRHPVTRMLARRLDTRERTAAAMATDTVIAATGPAGGGTVSGCLRINVKLRAGGRYLRCGYTPELSAGGSDTAELSALLICGGMDRVPQ
jgi:hypothetical protein